MKNLVGLQNRAARIITRAGYEIRCNISNTRKSVSSRYPKTVSVLISCVFILCIINEFEIDRYFMSCLINEQQCFIRFKTTRA